MWLVNCTLLVIVFQKWSTDELAGCAPDELDRQGRICHIEHVDRAVVTALTAGSHFRGEMDSRSRI